MGPRFFALLAFVVPIAAQYYSEDAPTVTISTTLTECITLTSTTQITEIDTAFVTATDTQTTTTTATDTEITTLTDVISTTNVAYVTVYFSTTVTSVETDTTTTTTCTTSTEVTTTTSTECTTSTDVVSITSVDLTTSTDIVSITSIDFITSTEITTTTAIDLTTSTDTTSTTEFIPATSTDVTIVTDVITTTLTDVTALVATTTSTEFTVATNVTTSTAVTTLTDITASTDVLTSTEVTPFTDVTISTTITMSTELRTSVVMASQTTVVSVTPGSHSNALPPPETTAGPYISSLRGPELAITAYTWHQYVVPEVIGTVSVIVEGAQTSSYTVFDAGFDNKQVSIFSRSDINSAETVTSVVDGTTVTYPDPISSVAAQLTWDAVLPITMGTVTCCGFTPTSSPTPTSHPAFPVQHGQVDPSDPRGWFYSLQPQAMKLGAIALTSLFGQSLTIPYSGCQNTACPQIPDQQTAETAAVSTMTGFILNTITVKSTGVPITQDSTPLITSVGAPPPISTLASVPITSSSFQTAVLTSSAAAPSVQPEANYTGGPTGLQPYTGAAARSTNCYPWVLIYSTVLLAFLTL